jgi:hypothetical protein
MGLRHLKISLLAGFCAACGTKSSTDFSDFHGIYRIDSYTWNQASCDAEGDAVSGARPYMVIFTVRFPGLDPDAEADSCSDPATCQDRAVNQPVMAMGSKDFTADFQQISADHTSLLGHSIMTDFDGSMAAVADNLLVRIGSGIRLEMRSREELPCVKSAGKCDPTATIAAAAAVPCTELRVVTATFEQKW